MEKFREITVKKIIETQYFKFFIGENGEEGRIISHNENMGVILPNENNKKYEFVRLNTPSSVEKERRY